MGLQNERFFGHVAWQLVVQNNVQEGFVNLDATVVFDKAELAKAVHEEADPRPGCPDHFRQSLLRDLGDKLFRFAGLSKLRHQQENSGQTLFAGVEELIDKIGLSLDAADQQKLQEQVGEVMFLVHHADHLFPLYLERGAGSYGGGRGQTQPRYRRQRPLSDKFACREHRNGGFLAGFRNDRHFCAALLKIENRVRRVSLRKERLLWRQLHDSSTQVGVG